MLKNLFLFFIIFFGLSIKASANFDFNTNCEKAYDAIFDLRINEARTLIKLEKKINPENGISVLLDNYVDFFSLLISENKEDYDRLKSLKNIRINQLLTQDKNSPYYLFAQAEINIQWAILKTRFQDYLSSGLDIKKADNLLIENEKKFPRFLPNKKSSSLVEVIFGAIPANMKGILQSFGFKGNAKEGIKQLENLSLTLSKTPYDFYKKEVVFFVCYIETDVFSQKSSYQKIINLTNNYSEQSLLKVYLQGYIAYRNAKNDEAIDYLQNGLKMGSDYLSFPKINYLLGSAKLNRNDADAHIYLAKYLKDYSGINLVKDAYLKLAYYYYLRNDLAKYQSFLNMVITRGNVYDEKDKQALKEAKDKAPDIDLLKARLSFDGGYYTRALGYLNDKNLSEFKIPRDQIEYYYRLGRIYDLLNRFNEALVNYQKAINLGKQSSYYFAANSALNMGVIYEQKQDKGKAVNYYKQAIAMKNHEYENSIENNSKEALGRLGY